MKENTTVISKEEESTANIVRESATFRVLNYEQRISEELYMTLCGIESDGSFKTEGRSGYHLHVVYSGKGTLIVDGKEYSICFGQMFMTKPNEKVEYCADEMDPWKYCWLTFDGTKSEEYAKAAGFKKDVYVLDCNIEPHLFFEEVKKILDHQGLNLSSDLYRTSCLYNYVGMAVESYYKYGQVVRRQREYSPDAYVEYALDFIKENFNSIKVSDVAKNIGINRSYLANIFKEKVGISPQEYLVQYRLNMGAKLLKNTNQSIQEIAQKIGYSDPLTFSKMFKKIYGVSPRGYRIQKTMLEYGE